MNREASWEERGKKYTRIKNNLDSLKYSPDFVLTRNKEIQIFLVEGLVSVQGIYSLRAVITASRHQKLNTLRFGHLI